MYRQEDTCAWDGGVEVVYTIHVSIILAPSGELSVQLNSHEPAILTAHTANELDGAVHITRHVDRIPYFEVSRIDLARGSLIASQGAQTGFAVHIGSGGGAERGRGSGIGVPERWSLQAALPGGL